LGDRRLAVPTGKPYRTHGVVAKRLGGGMAVGAGWRRVRGWGSEETSRLGEERLAGETLARGLVA